jgi:hypothetical protein
VFCTCGLLTLKGKMKTYKFKNGVTKLNVIGHGSFKEKDLTEEVYKRLEAINPSLVKNIEEVKHSEQIEHGNETEEK